jgi:hypothetical protein
MVFPATGEDGVNRYWLRSLETVEARPLPGTESAYVPAAWSSDSRYAIFTLQNSPKLYKVDIQGGPPQALAEAPGALNGATSNKDGVVVFGVFAPNPLFRVSGARHRLGQGRNQSPMATVFARRPPLSVHESFSRS